MSPTIITAHPEQPTVKEPLQDFAPRYGKHNPKRHHLPGRMRQLRFRAWKKLARINLCSREAKMAKANMVALGKGNHSVNPLRHIPAFS